MRAESSYSNSKRSSNPNITRNTPFKAHFSPFTLSARLNRLKDLGEVDSRVKKPSSLWCLILRNARKWGKASYHLLKNHVGLVESVRNGHFSKYQKRPLQWRHIVSIRRIQLYWYYCPRASAKIQNRKFVFRLAHNPVVSTSGYAFSPPRIVCQPQYKFPILYFGFSAVHQYHYNMHLPWHYSDRCMETL